MEQHFHEPLTVEQLAAAAYISPKYFVDLFKKTYGQSAMDFLTDLRINRAKRYLTETDYRLREIAQRVGYSDEFYFSRKFKKEVGVSPSSFAAQPKQRVAACSPSTIGQLLALGVIPVAAPLNSKWTPYYYHAYQAQIQLHMKYEEPNPVPELDRLVRIRPDAIIGTGRIAEEERRKLSGIAPSLFVDYQDEWRLQLRQVASFLRVEGRAASWIEEYERKLGPAVARLADVIGQDLLVVLRVNAEGVHLYRNRGIEEVLHQDLGLSFAYSEEPLYNRRLTLSELNELHPDRMLVLVCPEAASRIYWLTLQHDPEWLRLKAVQSGCVHPIPSDPWLEYSAFSVSRMLDEMLLLFTGYCPSAAADTVHGCS
jgi:ABC-type Fe3+-hydroxamate transport system substrate-binding protein